MSLLAPASASDIGHDSFSELVLASLWVKNDATGSFRPVGTTNHLPVTTASMVLTGQLTVLTAAYGTSGEVVGGLITFPNAVRTAGDRAIVQSVILSDRDRLNQAFNLILFDSNPSATTFSEGLGLTLNDADLRRVAGHVAITSSDYLSLLDNSFATKTNVGLEIRCHTTSLFGVLISTGSGTFTFTNTDALQIKIGLLRD